MKGISRRDFVIGSGAALGLAAQGVSGATSPGKSDNAMSRADLGYVTGLPNGMDGLAMAEAIRTRKMSSLEAVDDVIAKAKTVNGKLNCIVSEYFEAARIVARGQRYEADGPFAGVPTFMKDLPSSSWAGQATRNGSRAYAKAAATEEDTIFAAAWRKAGIISLGRSTVPEFGLLPSTQPLSSGPTLNPWDPKRDVSGSSGGAAALVAARVIPFAQASDGGGSIRTPASTCGVFGLMPSRGRLPTRPEKRQFSITVTHAETITVRDSLALFKCTSSDLI